MGCLKSLAAADFVGRFASPPTKSLARRCANVAFALSLLAAAGPAQAATITVDTPADTLTTAGVCSLRAALQAANTNAAVLGCPAGSGADTIVLPAGTYAIALDGTNEDANLRGDFDVLEAVTIQGAGAPSTILQAGGKDRVFDVLGGSLALSGVTVTGGYSSDTGGGLRATGGTLSLLSCKVSGNSAYDGAALYATRAITVVDSLVSNNTVPNASTGHGGIALVGAGTADSSLVNSTVSANTGRLTGGLWVDSSSLRIESCTIANNQALSNPSMGTLAFAGGLGVRQGSSSSGTVSLSNTILTGNFYLPLPSGGSSPASEENDLACADAPFWPHVTSAGSNSVSGQSRYFPCTVDGFDPASDQVGFSGSLVAVAIGPLSDNGGPTATHALPAGSSARESGSCPALTHDQRGSRRPVGLACDRGAVEMGFCGDGFKAPDEPCDDGAGNSDTLPDHCRTSCRLARCGDGVIDSGEACDGGPDTGFQKDQCRPPNCVLPWCGDNVRDTGEECDWLNSDTTPDRCRTNCKSPRCGDGVKDTGEECDDGPNNDDTLANKCRTSCKLAHCGDGVRDNGEACDDGALNSDSAADACRTTCKVHSCGDGAKDSDEQCDDPAGNDPTLPNRCRPGCLKPSCGDGVHDWETEVCDDGALNSDTAPNACRTDCRLYRCGDGVKDYAESCDDGPLNSDSTADACRTTCRLPRCNDGVKDSGEECDDGPANGWLASQCRTTCKVHFCGDGVKDLDEECDDYLQLSDTYPNRCRTNCKNPHCGDGVIDTGEMCDNGALNSDSDLRACHTNCRLSYCGDGILDADEECDDGDANANAPDKCRLTTCDLPKCGDRIVDTGEECDNGMSNGNTSNACRTNCKNPVCGDGVMDYPREDCDDGANNSDYVIGRCATDCTHFVWWIDGGIPNFPDAGARPDAAAPGADAAAIPDLDAGTVARDAAEPGADAASFRDAGEEIKDAGRVFPDAHAVPPFDAGSPSQSDAAQVALDATGPAESADAADEEPPGGAVGCGCSASSRGASWEALLAVAAAMVLVRRRRDLV
ncbi:MAG: choice-of-anchor Q domain-containing protein [Myxococcales bacterium]